MMYMVPGRCPTTAIGSILSSNRGAIVADQGHSKNLHEEVRAFFARVESAQVYAIDKRTGDLVFLPRGQADLMRQEAREHFRCPVPDCEMIQISTRGGLRRDHFFHLGENSHAGAPESELHMAGKLALGLWAERCAQTQALDLEVDVDQTFLWNGDHRSKPDVLVTWRQGGHRVVFEVECFNSTTPTTLQSRRKHYQDMGIPDVWVFGHATKHVRQVRNASDEQPTEIRISTVPAAIAEAGQPILIINPLEQTVGTLISQGPVPTTSNRWNRRWWDDSEHYGLNFSGARGNGALVEIRIDNLDECELHETFGIVTPTMRQVFAERARIVLAANDAREWATKWANEDRARKERGLKSFEQSKAYAIARKEEREKKWEVDPLRQVLLDRYSEIPEVISHELRTDFGIFAHPVRWHALVFENLVRKKAPGHTFNVANVYALLLSYEIELNPDGAKRGPAVCGYLLFLRSKGYLDFDDEDHYILGEITVLPPPMDKSSSQNATGSSPDAVLENQARPGIISPRLEARVGVHWHVHAGRLLMANSTMSFPELRSLVSASVSDSAVHAFWEDLTEHLKKIRHEL